MKYNIILIFLLNDFKILLSLILVYVLCMHFNNSKTTHSNIDLDNISIFSIKVTSLAIYNKKNIGSSLK